MQNSISSEIACLPRIGACRTHPAAFHAPTFDAEGKKKLFHTKARENVHVIIHNREPEGGAIM